MEKSQSNTKYVISVSRAGLMVRPVRRPPQAPRYMGPRAQQTIPTLCCISIRLCTVHVSL